MRREYTDMNYKHKYREWNCRACESSLYWRHDSRTHDLILYCKCDEVNV